MKLLAVILAVVCLAHSCHSVCMETAMELFEAQEYTYCHAYWDSYTITDLLPQICTNGGVYDQEITCLRDYFSSNLSCDASYLTTLDGWFESYKNRLCDGTTLRYTGGADVVERVFGVGSCLNFALLDEDETFLDCFIPVAEFINSTAYSTSPIVDILPTLNRLADSYVKCNHFELAVNSDCDEEERIVFLFNTLRTMPPGITIDPDIIFEEVETEPFQGPRSTVGAFGDPHLLVYGEDEIETCGMPGEHVLVGNVYFTLWVNNEPWDSRSNITIVNRVVMALYDDEGDTVATYTASNELLPASFDDGSAEVSLGDSPADVVTVQSGRDDVVVLKHRGSGSGVLIVRHSPWYPVVLVRLADNVLDDSYGLAVHGCSDPIDRGNRRRRAVDCDAACADAGDYSATCLFDCDTTGDADLASATAEGVVDGMEEMAALDVELSSDPNAAPHVTSTGTLLVAAMFLTYISQQLLAY